MKKLITHRRKNRAAISLVTLRVKNYIGPRQVFLKYGRIKRDGAGKFITKLIEYQDATYIEKNIKEVNSGFYCFEAGWLQRNLGKIKLRASPREYYLTDLINMAVEQGRLVVPVNPLDGREGMGANSLSDVKRIERIQKPI